MSHVIVCQEQAVRDGKGMPCQFPLLSLLIGEHRFTCSRLVRNKRSATRVQEKDRLLSEAEEFVNCLR